MTVSVLPIVTPMSSPGTEAAPPPTHPVGTAKGNRFSDLLSRRMRPDEDAENADALTHFLPGTHDTVHTTPAHAATDLAELNANILAQTRFVGQENMQGDASDASSTPSDHAVSVLSQHPSHTQRGLGQTGRATLHVAVTSDAALSHTERAKRTRAVDGLGGMTGMGGMGNIGGMRKPVNTPPNGLVDKTHTDTASAKPGDAVLVAETLHANAHETLQTPPLEHAIDAMTGHAHNNPAFPSLVSATAGHTGNPTSSLPMTGAGTLALPVHHPQWSQALGQHLVHLSHASAQSPQTAQLRLDPPELGPLSIAIELHQNVAHATFVSAHAPVRLAVENALPHLQEQLAQAGISLGQTSVSDQGAAQQTFDPQDAPPFSVGQPSAQPTLQPPHSAATRTHHAHALIDTFA